MSTPSFGANKPVTDVQINSLILQAIQTHPLVGSAKAEQEATTEGVTAAKLNLLPVPSLSTGYDAENDLVSQVNIRQPLWTGGKLTADINRAIFDDKSAIENIYEQQNQVAKTTIEAWQGYITAVAQQRVYLSTLKQLEDFEQMMQRRVSQGVSARIELDLVTNRILQEQNAYQAAVEQQRISVARLEQIIGHPISEGSVYTIPKLSTMVEQAKLASTNFEKMAFNEVSFYNPSVVKEYFQIESAKEEVKAQKASRYPALYAEYAHTYQHNPEDEDDDKSDGKFSVGLDYQPGAGFSNLALARASEARVNSLIQNQEAARRSVMENIQVQYQQFASAKNRELSLIAAVAGAQIVVNSYRRQFIAGRKDWSEVLNAVRELSGYQVQLVQTRSDILASFYKLQVDFGLMPWQTFASNRISVERFSVGKQVKDWLQNKEDLQNSQNFGYNNTLINSEGEPYVEISLPASAQQQLDSGAVLMIGDNQDIQTVGTTDQLSPAEQISTVQDTAEIQPIGDVVEPNGDEDEEGEEDEVVIIEDANPDTQLEPVVIDDDVAAATNDVLSMNDDESANRVEPPVTVEIEPALEVVEVEVEVDTQTDTETGDATPIILIEPTDESELSDSIELNPITLNPIALNPIDTVEPTIPIAPIPPVIEDDIVDAENDIANAGDVIDAGDVMDIPTIDETALLDAPDIVIEDIEIENTDIEASEVETSEVAMPITEDDETYNEDDFSNIRNF